MPDPDLDRGPAIEGDPADPVAQALRTAQQVATPKPGLFDDKGNPTYSKPTDPFARKLTPLGLYSHAADVAAKLPQAKGTPEQYKAMLLKAGVKPDELRWSNYDQKFAGKKQISKQELKQHFDRGLPNVQEREHSDDTYDYSTDRGEEGGPKYKDYTLPGGQNYRELLLHLPKTTGRGAKTAQHLAREAGDDWNTLGPNGRQRYQDEVARLKKNDGVNYNSSHWDTPNVLAHLRMSDRPHGEKRDFLKGTYSRKGKALHLEELQSDWAQEGREKGFAHPENAAKFTELGKQIEPARRRLAEHTKRLHMQVFGMPYEDYLKANPEEKRSASVPLLRAAKRADPDYENSRREVEELEKAQQAVNPAGKTPHGPYVDSTSKWLDLALKRALVEAARGGHDKILITPGEEQAKRYDLSKHVNAVRYFPQAQNFQATLHNGHRGIDEHGVKPEDVEKYVGKDVAKKLLETPLQADDWLFKTPHHHLGGLDLKVGGEGMKAFYDRIVPQALEKLAKKHDPEAKVQLHSHALKGGPEYKIAQRGSGWRVIDNNTPAGDYVGGVFRSWHEANNHIKEKMREHVKLHSLEITPKMRESIKKGLPAFHEGGAVEGYKSGGYVDPKAEHIGDWNWRPLGDVQDELGLHEIPSHVEKFGSFMDDTARRAELHGLTPRDLIKAFTIARSSIQRGAVDSDRVRKAGLILPDHVTGKIRPEGAFGTWLHTRQGQRYLDEAEAGRPDEPSIAHAVQVMAPFGKHEKDIPDALRWAAMNLPGREGRISELVARARRGQSDPSEWREHASDIRGIGSSKAGFLASMLGRGDQPTLDARQLILHTGKPSKESSAYIARKGGQGGVEAVDRLAGRQQAMNLKTDPDLKPYYQHLAHHAVWDKAGNETTTHSDVIDALRHAATGGAIMADHPIIRAFRTAGLPSFKRGGSPDDDVFRRHFEKLHSPLGGDPETIAEAMRIVQGLKPKMDAVNKQAGYYTVNQPEPPTSVSSKVGPLKGATPVAKRQMSWEDLNREGKGGSFINLGGDRSNFGKLTHINDKKLAWPVNLHAGPGYMRELNPGAVWANSVGHSTALKNKIQEAARTHKGPVYGVYAPMGPRAVDSAHNMFDALMAQIPASGISKKDALEFDRQLKAGAHVQGNSPKDVGTREAAKKLLKDWPGILNAKEASKFARKLPGVHRSAIIAHMDKGEMLKKGFPAVGMTRVALTDPDVLNAPGNMIGHRVVELDPSGSVNETAFKHSTYPSPTPGKYVGDLPLVQRQYAMPAPTRAALLKPTKAGQLVHPFSPDSLGRSTSRKLFEEQKQVQPLDAEQLDSVMTGLERHKQYGFRKGGKVDHAPSEAQKQAGNYSKGHLSFQGLPITIENKKGSERSGVGPNGKRWSVKMPADYGYIKRTEGADGDHVDVYVGPDKASPIAFIVNQCDHRTKKFDEHKIVLGTRSEREARNLYCDGFSDGRGHDRLASMEPVSIDSLKHWLKQGVRAKPAKSSALVDHALRIAAGAQR